MTAKELRKSLDIYLERESTDVSLKSTKDNAEIDKWEAEEDQPTYDELKQIWNDNKDKIELEKEKLIKESEVKQMIREKMILENGEYITKKALIDEAKTIDDIKKIEV